MKSNSTLGHDDPVLNRAGYRRLAWLGVAVLAAAVAAQFAASNWRQSFTISLFLISAVAFLVSRRRLPNVFSLLFVIAALMNAAGWAFDWFTRIPLYDPVTHAYTTFSITLAISFLTYAWVHLKAQQQDLYFGLFVAAVGLSLGALWEIVEWSFGAQQTYRSVVIDLIADSVGAAAAGWLGVVVLKRIAKSPGGKNLR